MKSLVCLVSQYCSQHIPPLECRHRWSHPRKFGPVEMTPPTEGGSHFQAKVKVPLDAFKMDFVFSDVQV